MNCFLMDLQGIETAGDRHSRDKVAQKQTVTDIGWGKLSILNKIEK